MNTYKVILTTMTDIDTEPTRQCNVKANDPSEALNRALAFFDLCASTVTKVEVCKESTEVSKLQDLYYCKLDELML